VRRKKLSLMPLQGKMKAKKYQEGWVWQHIKDSITGWAECGWMRARGYPLGGLAARMPPPPNLMPKGLSRPPELAWPAAPMTGERPRQPHLQHPRSSCEAHLPKMMRIQVNTKLMRKNQQYCRGKAQGRAAG